MKFETHVHLLFDAIRKNDLRAGPTYEACKKWSHAISHDFPQLQRAPVYLLRGWANELFAESVGRAVAKANLEGRFRLPHPFMLVEMTVAHLETEKDPTDFERWIVFGYQMPEHVGIIVFDSDGRDPKTWFVRPPKGKFKVGSEMIEVGAIESGTYDYFDAKPEAWEDLTNDTTLAACIFCSLCYLMDQPATPVISEAVTVPKEVNRGRSLLKKSRVPDHTILTLPKVVHVSADGQSLHGSHASPKTHWRRSHERHYASGKVVRVPETVVNHQPGQPLPPPPVTEIVLR